MKCRKLKAGKRLFTLSFQEYLTFKSKYDIVDNPQSELVNYIRFGGFPATQLQKYSEDEIHTIARDIDREDELRNCQKKYRICRTKN